VSLKTCDRCKLDTDIWERPPCCIHETACALAVCFPCGRISYRGSCATEWLRENPPRLFFVIESAERTA